MRLRNNDNVVGCQADTVFYTVCNTLVQCRYQLDIGPHEFLAKEMRVHLVAAILNTFEKRGRSFIRR